MKTKLFFTAAAALLLSGCNVMVSNSGNSLVFTEVTEPIAYVSGVKETKRGEACQESFFGLVSTGDSSIERAKEDGGITNVASINVTKKNVLVYGIACTVVRGN